MKPMQAAPAARRQHGLSLVEAMIVLFVLSILCGSALPNLQSLLARQRLMGTAAELETDIQLARSESVARNQPVRLTLNAAGVGQGSCYIVHTGPADVCRCDAGQAPRCELPAQVLRAVSLPESSTVQLRSAVRSIAFDGTLGTSTPTATLRLVPHSGPAVHQVVNVVGRIRSCASGGPLPGLRAC